MTHLQAAFTFTGRVSSARLQCLGPSLAAQLRLPLHRQHVGVAGDWVIVSAHFGAISTEQGQRWLNLLLLTLEQDTDHTELFRVRIDHGAAPRREADTQLSWLWPISSLPSC